MLLSTKFLLILGFIDAAYQNYLSSISEVIGGHRSADNPVQRFARGNKGILFVHLLFCKRIILVVDDINDKRIAASVIRLRPVLYQIQQIVNPF